MEEKTKDKLLIVFLIIISIGIFSGLIFFPIEKKDMLQQPENFREELQCMEWDVEGIRINRYNADIICYLSNEKALADKCNWVSINSTTLSMNITYQKRFWVNGKLKGSMPEYQVFQYDNCTKKQYVMVRV